MGYFEEKSLNGKRVLITSWSLSSWGGATINALELAKHLQSLGMVVDLFSYDIDGPVAQYAINTMGVEVFTDQIDRLQVHTENIGISDLDISNYDYIWVNANIIPISIISGLGKIDRCPKFIFLHMSALPGYPLDAPLLAELELGIASAILSISDDTTEGTIRRILGPDVEVFYYRNPAPIEFSLMKERQGELMKIAVISSSHPSDEIMELEDNIKNLIPGVQVEYIGRYNNNEKVVDAELYDEYDLIIGIGKNVQYSLVSGVPVYVYGKFGGSGYLRSDNIDDSRSNNFSGRGFSKKDSKTIAEEIVSGYKEALLYHSSHRSRWIQEYSLDRVVGKLFRQINSVERKISMPNKQQINWLVSMQILISQYLQDAGFRDKYNSSQLAFYDQRKYTEALENEASRMRAELGMRVGSRVRRRVSALKKKISSSW